ncbi:MAG: peptidoglycan-binding protein [Acidobacteria bacterium]|nr:peptidoglycan-binding protein [Acidobacteriota bacterium]
MIRVAAVVFAAWFAIAGNGYAYTHIRRGPTAPNASRKHGTKHAAKPTGPRAMDSDRATAIQSALIKSGYMTGTPSGHWDASSEAAMQKLQADNGWQTKITPDSRALIKLGLGPKADEPASSGDSAGGMAAGSMSASSARALPNF